MRWTAVWDSKIFRVHLQSNTCVFIGWSSEAVFTCVTECLNGAWPTSRSCDITNSLEANSGLVFSTLKPHLHLKIMTIKRMKEAYVHIFWTFWWRNCGIFFPKHVWKEFEREFVGMYTYGRGSLKKQTKKQQRSKSQTAVCPDIWLHHSIVTNVLVQK